MKTDLYTKAILTVIAIALIGLFFKTSTPIPNANAAKMEYQKYSLIPVNSDGSINVKFTDILDVNIEKVDGSSVIYNIPVSIEECTTSIRVRQ